jgi:hypothetical protein
MDEQPSESRALGFGHLPVLLPDEVSGAGLCSPYRVERADSLVDFLTRGAQLLDT